MLPSAKAPQKRRSPAESGRRRNPDCAKPGAIAEFCIFCRVFDLGRFHHIQRRGLLSWSARPIMRTAQGRQAELLSCWMRCSGVRRMILK
jgi:hypothetical protein